MYRVNKSIRNMMVFSEQDIIKDPPFSKIDLISCRNLLIYLSPELQGRILPLFHYALSAEGMLFLGNSESVGDSSRLFTTLDQKSKLYRRKSLGQGVREQATMPPLARGIFLPRDTAARVGPPKKLPARDMAEQELLVHAGLVGALVNGKGDILYLHGRSGLYLEPASGEPNVSNILKMAREGLRLPLAAALRKSSRATEIVRVAGIGIQNNGQPISADLTVRPIPTGQRAEAPLFLVVLEQPRAVSPLPPALSEEKNPPSPSLIDTLQNELRAKDEYLRSTNEQLQSATEELQSSNEEMQSVNEELQSTNEELETSKEELQSVNEELSTVNAELQTKVLSLSEANNDMNNLLAGTGIGTLFVDHQLQIMRFTPAVTPILNLIRSDVGRPLAHIVSNLVGYDRLVADVQMVLDTLAVKQIEVQTNAGKSYSLRIQPYRTADNVIEGAVISFIEITEIVKTRDDLHKANELMRLAIVVRDSHEAITVQDLDGRILAWNPAATRTYGWSESEALQMNGNDRIPEKLRPEELSKMLRLAQGDVLPAYQTMRLTKTGEARPVEVSATSLSSASGHIYAIATTERVIGSFV